MLAPVLTKLFSLCFRHGYQPQAWRLANVVPVHKHSSRSQLKNYRPVSLLSVISKVMEIIINMQITNYLEGNSLLAANQFGFRRNLGTADALTALHHSWASSIGHGGAARVLAVDIAGAFDKVSHAGVLFKLQQCGIQGILLAWLTSYLSNRSIQCVVGGATSRPYPIKAGVPQGSILGPTMFLIYINDVSTCLAGNTQLEAYADDTTLYTLLRNDLPTAAALLQDTVNRLSDWGKEWRVAFEPSKSQAMTVTLQRAQLALPSLLFGGNPVPKSSTIKLLGVTFDPKLSFAEHIRAVSIRGKQRLGLLRRAAPYLSREGRLTVYKGFVRPVLEYAPLVWMGAAPSHLSRLDSIQRRALRIIGPGTELQSLSLRRYVAALTYTYKLHFITGPTQLLAVLPPRLEPRDATRTRNDLRMAAGHSYQLRNPLPRQAADTILRSFPHCAIQL